MIRPLTLAPAEAALALAAAPALPPLGRLLPALLALLLLGGCRAAHMPVPETLASAERFGVEGRQGLKIRERLRFGPFEAADVDRSWTGGRDLQVSAFKGSRRQQHYAFVLREDGADRWDVACDVRLHEEVVRTPLVDVEAASGSALECTLQPAGGDAEAAWDLRLTERGDRPLEGLLVRGDEAWPVEGTRQLAGSLPTATTTGYRIGEAERPAGAVEVVGDGAVWLAPSLRPDERGRLAAATAALLLYEDLRVHLGDE